MMENPGSKIKVAAWILLVLGVFCSIALAVDIFLSMEELPSDYPEELRDQLRTRAILYVLIGPAVSWFISLLVYGYGKMIETAEMTERRATQTCNLLTKLLSKNSTGLSSMPINTNRPQNDKKKKCEDPNKTVICQCCGTKNLASRSFCWDCEKELD